ncbi:hypothetical protein TUMEXPCC7403_16930 [Tumidithrix helvetica PCC 7403]|uniref:hypothetical protein n=1 Tax=Tumidithrix helvetica TaxID=3457545 RepID=UPI003C9950F4
MKQTHHQTEILEKNYGKQLCGYATIDGKYIPVTFHPAIGWYFMDAELYFHFIDEPTSDRTLTQCDRIISTTR